MALTMAVWRCALFATLSMLATAMVQKDGQLLSGLIQGRRGLLPPTANYLLTCGDTWRQVLPELSRAGLQFGVCAEPSRWEEVMATAKDTVREGLVTFVLDAACSNAQNALLGAHRIGLLRIPFRWLVHSGADSSMGPTPSSDNQSLALPSVPYSFHGPAGDEGRHLQGCLHQVSTLLDGVPVPLDSDLAVTCVTPTEQVVALSAYRIGPTKPIRLSVRARWSALDGILEFDRTPIAIARTNLDKTEINIAVVSLQPEMLKTAVEEGGSTEDFVTVFCYDVQHYMVEMLNATAKLMFEKDWGTVKNNTPTGLLKLLGTNTAQMGGPFVMTADRLPYLKYHNYNSPAKGVFMFRAPPVSYEHNLFTMPFPPSLWACCVGLVLACAVMLMVVLRAEESMLTITLDVTAGEGQSGERTSWADVMLLSVGALCQQGTALQPRSVSSRTITIVLFLAVVFLYTSYSASIVALMQSTSTSIRTYRDLLNASIPLMASHEPYSVFYISHEQDPIRKAIYWERMVERGRRKAFISPKEGVNRVRKEYFAFHGISNIVFDEVQRTWQEHEKCGLVYVWDFSLLKNPEIVTSKDAAIHENVRIGLSKVTERGIRGRMVAKYTSVKPTCSNAGSNFQSVSLTDCRGAFQILCIFMGCAVLLLFVEMIVHSRVSKWKRTRPRWTSDTPDPDTHRTPTPTQQAWGCEAGAGEA